MLESVSTAWFFVIPADFPENRLEGKYVAKQATDLAGDARSKTIDTVKAKFSSDFLDTVGVLSVLTPQI